MKIDHIFETIAGEELKNNEAHGTFPLPRNFDCLRNTISHYETHCGRLEDYSLKYVKYLVKACETLTTPFDGFLHKI